MFIDAWNIRLTEARQEKNTLADQIKNVESQIEALLYRIVDASSPSVIQAYEKRIDKLEREKIKLGEQAAMKVPPKGRLEEFIEHALTFLGNPWKLYESGGFAFKRTVLKLAFAEPLRYNRDSGYRTAKITFPFKVLADISTQKCGMVEPGGIEPPTS
jgi:site-specific DNA recombinase